MAVQGISKANEYNPIRLAGTIGSVQKVGAGYGSPGQSSNVAASGPHPGNAAKSAPGQAGDRVEISGEGRAALEKDRAKSGGKKAEETPEFKNAVRELINQENKVIAHEQAHKSAGGEFAGAAVYSYTVGPDGRRYVCGGEVPINIPASDDRERMVQILERVKRAALAPADPSGQDLRVAAQASAEQMSLRGEIAGEKAQEAYGKYGTGANGKNAGGTGADNKAVNRGPWFDRQI